MLWFAASICLATMLGMTLLYAIVFPAQPHDGKVSPATTEESEIAGRLAEHIRAIASKPRNLAHYPALEAAASYIELQLVTMGYAPAVQDFVVDDRPVRNIEVVVAPAVDDAQAPTLVIGAHYDSADESPGANDNGTGVAALIEMSRLLRGASRPRCRLRLVFFVNEEQPYGKTENMGSLRHARALAQSGERVLGMIALETLGYFSNEPNSQRFPPPFGLIYPRTGNFVAFVGLLRARRLVHGCVRLFRSVTDFPAIGGIAPSTISGIDLSDHWAYDKCGFPALMVTDTAPYRNPHYHSEFDLPETVNYTALARITTGLTRMAAQIAP